MSTFFQQTAQAMIAKHIDRDLCKIPFPPTAEIQTQIFGCRGKRNFAKVSGRLKTSYPDFSDGL